VSLSERFIEIQARRREQAAAILGLGVLGVGSWVLGLGSWVLGVGSWVLGLGVGSWVLGSGQLKVDSQDLRPIT